MVAKFKGDKKFLVENYNKALEGDQEARALLPDDFALHLDEARLHVDNLTRELIAQGVISSKSAKGKGLKETLEENIGSYLNRSYRVFSDKNWKDNVSEEVKTSARNFLRRTLKASAKKALSDPKQNPQNLSLDEFLELKVEGKMNEYLNGEITDGYVNDLSKVYDEQKKGKGQNIAKKTRKENEYAYRAKSSYGRAHRAYATIR